MYIDVDKTSYIYMYVYIYIYLYIDINGWTIYYDINKQRFNTH